MTEERRQHLRVEWISSGSIVTEHGRSERPCTVYDLSNGGAKLSGIMGETLPDAFTRLTNTGGSRLCTSPITIRCGSIRPCKSRPRWRLV